MSSTRLHQRVFAMVFALLFLATALAGGAVVVWQIHQDGKKTPVAQSSSTTDTTKQGETTLQGTKLSNFEPIAKIDKLTSIDTVVGTGEEVKAGASVTAHYTGAVAATGIIFQSSHDGANQPIPFSLNGVIQGWTEGVPGMKVGGTRRLLIPAAQAYGANPPAGSGIPANADLVFDIELTAVQNN